jgi:REP element-mobilizing transposase RayT
MPRARKVHVQQALALPEPKKWGGKREGAGRPPKGKRSSERHKTRPRVLGSQPVHVICRVARDVGSLRKNYMFAALRWATIAVAKHEDFRIVHFSIQGTHLHLIVEAENRTALSKGMKALLISGAKQIHAAIYERTGTRRKGKVFTDRFHMRILKTPREVRNAIAYVLNNWRHHDEDRANHAKAWKVDPFSNAWQFNGWKQREGEWLPYRTPRTYLSLVTWFPKSWLLREGWRKHGLISIHEIPGARA